MKKINSIIQNSITLNNILETVKKHKSISVSPMPGSSKECITSLLTGTYNAVLLLLSGEAEVDNVGQNLKAYLDLLKINVELIPCMYCGQGTDRFDRAIYNDKVRALISLKENKPIVVLASLSGYLENITFSEKNPIIISIYDNFAHDLFIKKVFEKGYERVRYVELPGEFAVRGGIVDVYGIGNEWPVRIEFFDYKISLLKKFDPSTQRTFKDITALKVFGFRGNQSDRHNFNDYFKKSNAAVIFDSGVLEESDFNFNKTIFCFDVEESEIETNDKIKEIQSGFDSYSTYSKGLSNLDSFLAWIKQNENTFKNIFISGGTKGETHRLRNLIEDHTGEQKLTKNIFTSKLLQGFIIKNEEFSLLTDAEIFQRYQTRARGFRFGKGVLTKPAVCFEEGDYVVHFSHGIGIYKGTTLMEIEGEEKEVLILEYLDDSKLYVPADQFFLIEKYVGSSHPKLDKLGSSRWARKKEEAYRSIQDYASKILKIEAKRETKVGESYYIDMPEIYDFEHSFRFQETNDQEKAIFEVKEDLKSKHPMNRLILGDAGFGKTEVASRAAFITAMNGKQAAMLVPTTILAEQHYKTFKERMADYPIRVEVLSRFTSGKKQSQIINDLQKGLVDIVIGTHRLVQKDVTFKELGLLIIDEEQRFGVAHKDFLVQKNPLINILNLSATPIPRTLYLSLMGIRNMSAIMTAPNERRPIETTVMKEDWIRVKNAILAEISRNGQVFFVHNRINSIDKIYFQLKKFLPDKKIEIAHGRLPELSLKQIMEDFEEKKTDILIATNIIESGLDLPNVNTLIIHHADKFGLAELYQLRGRVGRFNRKAYAYFMLTPGRYLDSTVKKRIDAIQQFSKPGGGFQVAMKDLEIRGAGNILGTMQSGHIAAIGFDLYCKLLRDAVKSLKGLPITPKYEVIIFLGDFPFIPGDYITDFYDRFNYYKQLASSEVLEEIDKIENDIEDKFGKLPWTVKDLIYNFKIKCLARQKGILKIEKQGNFIETTYLSRTVKKLKLAKNYDSIFNLTFQLIRKL